MNSPTDPVAGRSAPRKADGNPSRGNVASERRLTPSRTLALAVLALGIGAAIAMVIADLSPVYTVTLTGSSCQAAVPTPELQAACDPTAGARHSHALIVLAIAAAIMAFAAGPGRSLPATFALLALGAAVLAIALIGDLPDVDETGILAGSYSGATASPASGFFLELVGGVLALGAGALGLVRRRATS